MAGVIGTVWKNPAFRPSPLDGSIVVHGNRCEYAGGVSAILTTSDLDIDGLDPARKAAAAKIAPSRQCAVPSANTRRGDHAVSAR